MHEHDHLATIRARENESKRHLRVHHNLQIQGYALRMRWLWAKRTDPNRPWSALPDHAESLVLDMFNASISIQIGNGQRSYFWTDRWIQGRSIKDLAPALLAAVRPRAQRQRTVAEGLSNRAWVRDITGALTVQVISSTCKSGT